MDDATATAHPAVTARLVEQLDDLSRLVDNAPTLMFADEDLKASAERLVEGIEAGLRAVEVTLHELTISGPSRCSNTSPGLVDNPD